MAIDELSGLSFLPAVNRGAADTRDSEAATVVLISDDTEWQVVRTSFAGVTPRRSPYGEWFTVPLPVAGADHPAIFLHGGWSKVAAAASTEHAITAWSPDLVVNLGTCGGFAGQIEPGSIVLAERTVIYDIVEQMGDPEAVIARFSTDLDLAYLQDPLPLEVVRSTLVSGDRDLIPEEVERLRSSYGAVAGDWESGAIAYVAARHGLRCLILRTVTDLVGPSGGEAYGNLELYQARTHALFPRLLESLPDWIERSLRAAPDVGVVGSVQ